MLQCVVYRINQMNFWHINSPFEPGIFLMYFLVYPLPLHTNLYFDRDAYCISYQVNVPTVKFYNFVQGHIVLLILHQNLNA